jgi:hypothetical protein
MTICALSTVYIKTKVEPWIYNAFKFHTETAGD